MIECIQFKARLLLLQHVMANLKKEIQRRLFTHRPCCLSVERHQIIAIFARNIHVDLKQQRRFSYLLVPSTLVNVPAGHGVHSEVYATPETQSTSIGRDLT